MSVLETLTAEAFSAVRPPLRFLWRRAGVLAARVLWLGLEVVRAGSGEGRVQCGPEPVCTSAGVSPVPVCVNLCADAGPGQGGRGQLGVWGSRSVRVLLR